MTWYSNGPRDRIFVKDYGYFSIGRNIRKMFCECSVRDFLIILKNLLQMNIKQQKATSDLICNNIAGKITKTSRVRSETIQSKTEKKITW